jgi:salicylate hydroxylase
MPGKINDETLEIAIVGQGIIGLVLALGLIRRGVNVKVYEQASRLRVTGAGVAFTANAIQCMNLLDPQIVDALRSVATSNGDPANPNDYLRWVDGYSRPTGHDPREERLLFKLYAGTKGFEGCHRAHFVEALAGLMPEEVVHYSKRLDKIHEKGGNEKMVLTFHDGTTASADAGKIVYISRKIIVKVKCSR